ncbi:hypothetical protein K3495_g12300 [Podosphaera aphanis]|nr:hypothetical protein K3495_g12300 [Podosphaera aphanis]
MKGTTIFAFLASVYSCIAVGTSSSSEEHSTHYFSEGDKFNCDGRIFDHFDALQAASAANRIIIDQQYNPDKFPMLHQVNPYMYPNYKAPFFIHPMLQNGKYYTNLAQFSNYVLLDSDFMVVDTLTSQFTSCILLKG